MKNVFMMILTFILGNSAFAGFDGYTGTTHVGVFSTIKCSTGITCTKVGNKFNMVSSPTLAGPLTITGGSSTFVGGIVASSGQKNHNGAWIPSSLTAGTSTTPGATTVYMTQIFVPANTSLTGVKVSNGATVGTDKYIAALFDSSGAVVANSALAGATTAGADVYQALAFTAPYAAVGPAVYWVGLYVNGTTDRFRSIPAVGEFSGLAGSVTGQTFGTAASVTLPTTFTADKGPVAFTY